MTKDPHQVPPMFRIDVSANSPAPDEQPPMEVGREMVHLLRQMLSAQDRQNHLLEEIGQQLNTSQKQRSNELTQWKEANPQLAENCRLAAETLSRVQTEFLNNLTVEVRDSEDCLLDGEFMLNEFVDRFGPRLAHLNGVLQVLSQLSATN